MSGIKPIQIQSNRRSSSVNDIAMFGFGRQDMSSLLEEVGESGSSRSSNSQSDNFSSVS